MSTVVAPSSLSVVDDVRRLVALDAVHNFRDLGGYELADGRTIGWGRLFRADGLYRLTDDDLDVMDGLGIRTVIDLRSSSEVDTHGRYPVEKHPVAFHHLPIIDATWMQGEIPEFSDTEQGAIDFLVWAYRDMLAKGADRFAHAIQLLAVPQAGPAVFHCAAGKDRTGIMAALILAGLGVDEDIVVADYALTAAAMERMGAWVRANHPEMAERMSDAPSFMLAARPEAIRQILVDLRTVHGSIRYYLSAIGVGTAQLDALGDALTD
jgi:protein-tyrosine phosphatase